MGTGLFFPVIFLFLVITKRPLTVIFYSAGLCLVSFCSPLLRLVSSRSYCFVFLSQNGMRGHWAWSSYQSPRHLTSWDGDFLAVYHVVISVSSRDFDASGTLNAMFDELVERSLMSPLAGTKHTHVTLAIIIQCKMLALFFKFKSWFSFKVFFFKVSDEQPRPFYIGVPPPHLGRTCCFACVPDINVTNCHKRPFGSPVLRLEFWFFGDCIVE